MSDRPSFANEDSQSSRRPLRHALRLRRQRCDDPAETIHRPQKQRQKRIQLNPQARDRSATEATLGASAAETVQARVDAVQKAAVGQIARSVQAPAQNAQREQQRPEPARVARAAVV